MWTWIAKLRVKLQFTGVFEIAGGMMLTKIEHVVIHFFFGPSLVVEQIFEMAILTKS